MSKTSDQQEKDARGRFRAVMDDDLIHVKVGTWRGLDGDAVRVVGNVSELHGSVCTCCPKRPVAAAEAGAA